MAIANPRIHIICGICGCNKELHYKIIKEPIDDGSILENFVYIYCDNCGSITLGSYIFNYTNIYN